MKQAKKLPFGGKQAPPFTKKAAPASKMGMQDTDMGADDAFGDADRALDLKAGTGSRRTQTRPAGSGYGVSQCPQCKSVFGRGELAGHMRQAHGGK